MIEVRAGVPSTDPRYKAFFRREISTGRRIEFILAGDVYGSDTAALRDACIAMHSPMLHRTQGLLPHLHEKLKPKEGILMTNSMAYNMLMITNDIWDFRLTPVCCGMAWFTDPLGRRHVRIAVAPSKSRQRYNPTPVWNTMKKTPIEIVYPELHLFPYLVGFSRETKEQPLLKRILEDIEANRFDALSWMALCDNITEMEDDPRSKHNRLEKLKMIPRVLELCELCTTEWNITD